MVHIIEIVCNKKQICFLSLSLSHLNSTAKWRENDYDKMYGKNILFKKKGLNVLMPKKKKKTFKLSACALHSFTLAVEDSGNTI